MTVDPQSAGYDPGPLKGYLKMLGVVYHYEEQGKVYNDCSLHCFYSLFVGKGKSQLQRR